MRVGERKQGRVLKKVGEDWSVNGTRVLVWFGD